MASDATENVVPIIHIPTCTADVLTVGKTTKHSLFEAPGNGIAIHYS